MGTFKKIPSHVKTSAASNIYAATNLFNQIESGASASDFAYRPNLSTRDTIDSVIDLGSDGIDLIEEIGQRISSKRAARTRTTLSSRPTNATVPSISAPTALFKRQNPADDDSRNPLDVVGSLPPARFSQLPTQTKQAPAQTKQATSLASTSKTVQIGLLVGCGTIGVALLL